MTSCTKIGVTGGIGCGKTYVCHQLERVFSVPVYDCDSKAKMLMQKDEMIRRGLTEMLGEAVYDASGVLNRQLLASYIFNNREHLAAVNALVHPRVKQDFLVWAAEQQTDLVAVESAILFSSGMDELVDYVIRITAPEDIRMERVLKRDGCDRKQVKDRMRNQHNEEGKAHFELVNDGNNPVEDQLGRILNEVKKRY